MRLSLEALFELRVRGELACAIRPFFNLENAPIVRTLLSARNRVSEASLEAEVTSLKRPFARQRLCLRDEVPSRQRRRMTTVEHGCNDIWCEETDPQKCRDVVGVRFNPPRGCFDALAGPAEYLFADIKSFDEQIDQRGVRCLRCRSAHDESHTLARAFEHCIHFQDKSIPSAINLSTSPGRVRSWSRKHIEHLRSVDLDIDVLRLNNNSADDTSDKSSSHHCGLIVPVTCEVRGRAVLRLWAR